MKRIPAFTRAFSRFMSLSNRLILYSSLQIFFVLLIVLAFSFLVLNEYKDSLSQSRVGVYEGLLITHYEGQLHQLETALKQISTLKPTPIGHEGQSGSNSYQTSLWLQKMLPLAKADFITLVNKQGKTVARATAPNLNGDSLYYQDYANQAPGEHLVNLKELVNRGLLGYSTVSTEIFPAEILQKEYLLKPEFDPQGSIMSGGKALYHPHPPWYTLQQKATVLSENRGLVLTVVTPVYEEKTHEVHQVLIAGILLNHNHPFLEGYEQQTNQEQAPGFLTLHQLEVAGPSGQHPLGDQVPASVWKHLLLQDQYTGPLVINGLREGYAKLHPIRNSQDEIIGSLGVVIDQAMFLSAVDRFWHYMALIGGFSLMLGILLAFFIARNISRPIAHLANKSQLILEGNLNVDIAEVPPSDEIATLNNTLSRMVKRLMDINSNLEQLITERTAELKQVNSQLTEKEDVLIAQNEELKLKEELLTAHNEELAAQEEELTDYISRLSEQQERERLVKWIVTSIRESLELDQVISRTTQEVGHLLKVDRCFIAAYNENQETFHTLQTMYRSADTISVLSDGELLQNYCPEIQHQTVTQLEPTVIHKISNYRPLQPFQDLCNGYGLQSAIIIPLVNKNELLGTLTVHQVLSPRQWSDKEVEILKDIGQQVSIALYQANLYREVQQATRLKSEFLANMSHEFRTPLNAIIGFSEMILSEHYGPLTQKQRDYTQNVIKSGHHLLTLVNDILDLSKVESGNMDLHYELFNLSKTIHETINIIKGMAYKKKIRINVNIRPGVNYAYADCSRFKQILYNLLSNAIKFTPEAGRIELRAYLMPTDQKTLMIDVEDTGIGIAEADRGKVFSEFQQIDASYARKQEGSGLGLALTQKLIEMHGGSIDFVSQVDKGTTFTLTLPCHISGELPKTLLALTALSNEGRANSYAALSGKDSYLPMNTVFFGADDPSLAARVPSPVPTPELALLPPDQAAKLLLITSNLKDFETLKQSFSNRPYRIKGACSKPETWAQLDIDALPDLILFETTYLETHEGCQILESLKTDPQVGQVPIVFTSIDQGSGKVSSLGTIDYLLEPLAGEILIQHLEKIRLNILKEEKIRILGIGNEYLSILLNHPTLAGYPNRFEILREEPGKVDSTMITYQEVPDLILLEMVYPLEPEKLTILEMLKSKIETKYIPIILVGSSTASPDTTEKTPKGNTLVGSRTIIPEKKQTLLRLISYTNLLKDIEYALRIKKEKA